MAKKKPESGSKKKARSSLTKRTKNQFAPPARRRLEREAAHIVDTERFRLGREMHDGLSQQIAGISLLATSFADTLKAENSPHAERAAKLASAIEDAKNQTRGLVKQLTRVDQNSSGLRVALEELRKGEIYLSDGVAPPAGKQNLAGRQPADSPLGTLSGRELQILTLIGQGRNTHQISEDLHLAVSTVETYRERLKTKLKLASGAELTRHAILWVMQNS
jgi:DNA-binding CsgD family transcriptional regulator